MNGGTRNLAGRVRLAWIAWRAAKAQRRLDQHLGAAPGARNLPWLWLPSPQGTTALLLALAACGITGGPAPETRATAPAAVQPLSPLQSAVSAPLPVVGSTEPQRTSTAPGRHASARSRSTAGPTADDIIRGDLSAREVAFTFDGGADANAAGEILDGLRTRNVRATMFLTGQFIRLHPDLVRRMVAEGHEVGNHLDVHPHLTTYERDHRQQTLPAVTREFLVDQLRRAEESLRVLTGQPMAPFWRAPFGEHNPEIRGWAAGVGYRHISWTRGAGTAEDLDTRDWVADRSSRIYRTREEIAARLVAFGQGRPDGLNGGIVLMHLASHRRTDRPHEILPEIVKALQGQGYRLVTISELLNRRAAGSAVAASEPTPTDNTLSLR
jgi:peptidoglycan/xylan/chitin deacetylase (PgdA/CDA1 family)